MDVSQFEQLKERAKELLAGEEYAADEAVEGFFNRTELLVKRIPDTELKSNLLRMFNEIKIRNRAFNNNQKLMALENFCETIINHNEAEKLFQNPNQFFSIKDAIHKSNRVKSKRVPQHVSEIDHLRMLYSHSAQKAAQYEEGELRSPRKIFEHPIVKWIGSTATALIIAYLVFRLGWN